MTFLLALLPIAVILALMVGLRWGASRAGAAGYLTALVIAILAFGAGPQLLAVAHGKALLLTIDVLFIIWMAFLLFRVADEAGAIKAIGKALPHLTADKGMQALIIGWVFASFLQGVGGFGVPVAVVAPLMVGLGFAPLAAVVIPSIGHSWAVTFGSLGSSFNAMMAATGLPEELLGPPAAFFLGVACLVVGLMVAHAAGGWNAVRRLLIPALLIGIAMAVGQYIAVSAGLWNIGAFIGAIVGLVVGFPLARRFRGEMGDNGKSGSEKIGDCPFWIRDFDRADPGDTIDPWGQGFTRAGPDHAWNFQELPPHWGMPPPRRRVAKSPSSGMRVQSCCMHP